jgi:predicted AlkP superfamily phosphohydrolase/phosphomutase
MKTPVIAIGLDAADPELLERWMSQGHLKNLQRLRRQGTYVPLNNIDYYRAETPWTTFLTGCSPEKTGYWAPLKLQPGTYEMMSEVSCYDFEEYPPFYALGEDYRVAVFDMPQARLSKQVNGVQALAWGAHSPLGPTQSQPATLLQELVAKHGEHPGLHKDHGNCMDPAALKRLQTILETGIARRSAICQDLLQREEWNLFLTMFGETHAAEHYLWHLSQPSHPLYPYFGARIDNDPMLEVFEAVDQAIGDILSKAPKNAQVVIFSGHGMDDNVMDLPSTVFLPEFLYRWSFPGRVGLTGQGQPGTPSGPPITGGRAKWGGWLGTVWSTKYESNPIKGFLRRQLPTKIFNRLEPFLGGSQPSDLTSPYKLIEQSDPLFFQVATWYKACWPQMKAFALPSFSEGYIRINLQGREPTGVVPLSEYDSLCEELTQALHQFVDARTGTPMVQKVVRTRQTGTETDPKLPDADLVVVWQEAVATDVVESPTLGRIGPIPHFRTGSHRARGFLMAQGPGIEPGAELAAGHALDLAPTILQLMGAPIPDYCEGQPLVKVPASVG